MRIVAVTACATGIAHTYMAAEQLERAAKALGHQIKVETQGSLGIENRLSEADIRSADLAIFASDIEIEGRDRFQGVRVVEFPVREAARNAAGLLAQAAR
jgi:fructose-specific phosphotransferase system IIB component